ncbi:MAG: hypothetical protein GX219_10365, partial [Tissierellia bacterium]|nr:hypothetical protein [Tissierellia bacterium]
NAAERNQRKIEQAHRAMQSLSKGGSGGRQSNQLLAYADGTNYAPGGLALVGEKGPELVQLPRGSKVFPNHISMKMMEKLRNSVMSSQRSMLSFNSNLSNANQTTNNNGKVIVNVDKGNVEDRKLGRNIGQSVYDELRRRGVSGFQLV